MALGKTNVTVYNTNMEQETGDSFSVSMSVVSLNSTNEIKDIISIDGKNVILVYGSQEIFISEYGSDYKRIDLGITVNDAIYSESMKKFIAVGTDGKKPKVKTSDNAVVWEEVDWGDFGVGTYNGGIMAIMEVEGIFLFVLHYKPANSTIYYAINVSFADDHYTYSEKISISGTLSSRFFKGNNRILFSAAESGTGAVIIPGETQVRTPGSSPLTIADGYFISKGPSKYGTWALSRSINGSDYDLVASREPDPGIIGVIKYEGYYYLFTDVSVCRGKTWAEALGKGDEEYVPYDGGAKTSFNSVTELDGKIALLCNGYIVLLNIEGKDNPIVETIETLSAKEALRKAKLYTAEKIALLEERVAALEKVCAGLETE